MVTSAPPFLLEADGVSIETRNTRLLTSVNLAVRAGDCLWLGGPSGAGKSTFLRMLARLWPTTGGALRLSGKDSTSISPHEWRARATFVPTPHIPTAPTVRGDLTSSFTLRVRRHREPPGPAELRQALDDLGLEDISLDRPTRELSQGQLARVAVARSLLAAPEILLLDEPTANLDRGATALVVGRVFRFVEDGGAAVIAAHADPWPGVNRVFHVSDGQVREGSR